MPLSPQRKRAVADRDRKSVTFLMKDGAKPIRILVSNRLSRTSKSRRTTPMATSSHSSSIARALRRSPAANTTWVTGTGWKHLYPRPGYASGRFQLEHAWPDRARRERWRDEMRSQACQSRHVTKAKNREGSCPTGPRTRPPSTPILPDFPACLCTVAARPAAGAALRLNIGTLGTV